MPSPTWVGTTQWAEAKRKCKERGRKNLALPARLRELGRDYGPRPDCGSWDIGLLPLAPLLLRPWDSDLIIPPALLGLQLSPVPSLHNSGSRFLIVLNLLLPREGRTDRQMVDHLPLVSFHQRTPTSTNAGSRRSQEQSFLPSLNTPWNVL